MRYVALATDYDGTLAAGGRVAEEVLQALRRLIARGRRVILVTGRQVEDLLTVFPESGILERIVAENGAIVYTPATHRTEALAGLPSMDLVAELDRRGVRPLSSGRAVISTDRRHERLVEEAIARLDLHLRIERNKDALMVLPEGIDKATGLRAALEQLGLAREQVVGIGDAENDLPLLAFCGLGIAVENALDAVKQAADRVTKAANGAGVVEVIEWLLAEDQ